MFNIKTNLLEVILFAMIIKCLALPAGLPEGLIAISLIISITYKQINSFKIEKNELETKINDLNEKLTSLMSSMSALKIDKGFKRGLNG